MAKQSNTLLDRFFTALISGDRLATHDIIDQVIDSDGSAELIISNLLWPTLEKVQTLHRDDQISHLSFQYAVRLLNQMVNHMQPRLERREARGETVFVTCGDEQSEELAGQLACDLLEADGYRVFFAGGGVANDEIVAQLSELRAHRLVIFGAVASTVPQTRLLIDRVHAMGLYPELQIVVGGGVFTRAEGLAEEIGADLWASDPLELVETMAEFPTQCMTDTQRTVGRKRRPSKKAVAA